MKELFFYFIPVFIGWSIPNFFIKNLRKTFDSVEIIILLHTIYHLILLPAVLITYFTKRKRVETFFNKVTSLEIKPLFSAITVVILGLAAQYSFNTLIKHYDVSFVVPVVRGVSAILIVLFGYYIFGENFTLKKIFGIITIVIGVILLS
mgnify:CR=1 FL=1